jgi:hypothetical protein
MVSESIRTDPDWHDRDYKSAPHGLRFAVPKVVARCALVRLSWGSWLHPGDRAMARSATAPLDRQIRRVRRRLFLQGLIKALCVAWAAALLIGCGWVFLQPLFNPDSPGRLLAAVSGGLLIAASFLATGFTILRRPRPLAVALEFDERFNLKERATTALSLRPADVSSPAGQALLADVHARVAPLRVAERFPIRLPWVAALPPVLGLVLFLLAFFYHPSSAPTLAAQEQLLAVEPGIKANVERKLRQLQKRDRLKAQKEQPRSAELQRIETELDKLTRKPRETREQAREVVKDLTTAEEQVKKREKELAERAQALAEQMKQLDRLTGKKPTDGPAQRLEKALDRADFQKARDEAEKLGRQLEAEAQADRLRKKVNEPELNQEQKKEAREQLQRMKEQGLKEGQHEQLQKQIDEIQDKVERLTRSEDARERLRQLEREGLLNREQLQRELDQLEKNSGQLDPQTQKTLEQIAQKLKEAGQCLRGGNNAEAAQKLKEAGELMQQLDGAGECKALADQLGNLQAAREALCQALDGKPAPGGPGGPASGRRPQSTDGKTGSVEDWAHSDFDKGRLQVIDHLPGDGFKGPRKPAEMSEDIRRAAQEAPEAIDRQRLPKSASEMAKGFFEKLRGSEKKD